MSSPKRGLGGGLSNLFGGDIADESAAEATESIIRIPVTKIEPNPNQPRKTFNPERLNELAESIKLHGLVTPITVRKSGTAGDKYQIIAGERRWRAARIAKLTEIPAMVLDANESEIMEMSLIENLQREDLNPIEEAEGFDLLMQQFGLTQEEVSQRVVKSRSAIANSLRLLGLPEEVREMVGNGTLSSGHARAVLSVADESKRVWAAKQMSEMTVRQAEGFAKKLNKPPKEEKSDEALVVNYMAEIEKELEGTLGRKVMISKKGKKSGSLTLEYYGTDDLERLIEALRGLRV